MKHFETFWTTLRHLETFWDIMGYFKTFWDILGYFEIFWAIMRHFETFWVILNHFEIFFDILGHLRIFWVIKRDLELFCDILNRKLIVCWIWIRFWNFGAIGSVLHEWNSFDSWVELMSSSFKKTCQADQKAIIKLITSGAKIFASHFFDIRKSSLSHPGHTQSALSLSPEGASKLRSWDPIYFLELQKRSWQAKSSIRTRNIKRGAAAASRYFLALILAPNSSFRTGRESPPNFKTVPKTV